MVFAPRIEYGDLDLTDVPFMVEWGFDLGSPVTLYEAINSLMVDGSYQSSPGHGNRENLSLSVLIEAVDSREHAVLAEALEKEASKPFNELRLYPGDDVGPVMVLDTFPANVSHDWNQQMEQANLRRYTLSIPALPFARALTETTVNWTDMATELDSLGASTGWSGSSFTVGTSGSAGTFIFSGTSATITKTFTIDRDFLWVASQKQSSGSSDGGTGALSAISIGGTSVSSSLWSSSVPIATNTRGGQQIVDVSAWKGKTVAVALTFTYTSNQGRLMGLWTQDYPNVTQYGFTNLGDVRPLGIGVIDVLGSARTGCHISFTAPAAGAFVYTAPDPVTTLREYGAGEMVFAKLTVPSGGSEVSVSDRLIWLPAGTHTQSLGFTDPQPVELHPDGVWPAAYTGGIDLDSNGTADGFKFTYPVDRRAAVSAYTTSGDKHLISPSPQVPEGFVGDAVHHEPHALHPGRCGFAVLRADTLEPIATTITYYRRSLIYAAG
jgi:hypothetical protein